ncbi:protein kinase family protein [Singulisphaera sp. Ch08]|uniref:Protein kinase family protein n=1 Tax=Singulisphaera sp. Ch08 TaxID=3120278 RepID=A0AAU7CGJ4_9BACT
MSSDSVDALIDSLWQGRLVEPDRLKELAAGGRDLPDSAPALAADLVRRGVLTSFQADECLAGRGSQLAVGPYRLLEPLGAGTRGRVFRARHDTTNQVVALKSFPSHRLPGAGATDTHRFHREAEAATRLRHPNLVTVLDDGTADGNAYLVMELVEGIDLPRFLELHGPLEPLQASRYAQQVALALQHAYERRLVPCDVALSDLIVTDRGASVKLLSACRGRLGPSSLGLGEFNFGSLLEPDSAGQAELSPTLESEAVREDAQSAILGLGRVLMLMLASRPVRVDDEADHQGEDSAPPLPAELALIVRTMLAEHTAQRYATPADCAEALARYCSLPTPNDKAAAVAALAEAPSTPLGPQKSALSTVARSSFAFVVTILLGSLAGAAITWFSSDAPTGSPEAVASTLSEPSPLDAMEQGQGRADDRPLPAKRRVENPPPDDPQYQALVQAGIADLKQNAIPAALTRLGDAIRLRPNLTAAYTRRAEAYSKWEAHRDAVADCNQAILLDPNNSVAYRLRGAALANLGDAEGAIADSTKAIELDASDAHAFNTRGVARFSRQEFRSAFDDFSAAVQIDETLAGALGNLAWLLATAPDQGVRNGFLAIRYARRACELTHWNDPVQLKNLAAAHAECREFDRAIQYQKQAMARGRNLPGTVVDQYQSMLNRYLTGQAAQKRANPSANEREINPRRALPSPVPSATEVYRGAQRSTRPFSPFPGMAQSTRLPFVPLLES